MQEINDIENTFCQSCTKYKSQSDCFQTEKHELSKIQNTLRKQTNKLQLDIEH